MDRIANRPRGFAFLRYATEEESKKAIEGMHGKVCMASKIVENKDKYNHVELFLDAKLFPLFMM